MSSLFRYKLTSGEIDQIAKIYQSGVSILTINRVYGFSFRSRVIKNALHRAGIEVLRGKRKIPLSQEQDIIKEYQSGISSYQLADKYNVTFGTICELLERNKIKRRDNRALSDKDELKVIEAYQSGKSVFVVSDMFGIHATTISLIMNRHGLSTRHAGYNSRQYKLNEHSFDNLNNEHASYWLGFIHADGSINKETLNIALGIKDLSHLEKLKSFLEYESPIQLYQAKTPKGNMNDYCRLSVHSQHLTNRLKELGIVKNRANSKFLLDILPKEMYKHFIRGVVDGDGSIDSTKHCTARLRFLGQADLLKWISGVINAELDLPSRTIYQRTGICGMDYGGALQARKAISWLYKDAQVFLERKAGAIKW